MWTKISPHRRLQPRAAAAGVTAAEQPSTTTGGSTHRRTGPERTGVPDGGRVAEGQSSEGQRHHGAAEQQLQQAEGEQRPPGQQLPGPAARHPRRSGQAAGSSPVRRLAELRGPADRTAGARQNHRQRHFLRGVGSKSVQERRDQCREASASPERRVAPAPAAIMVAALEKARLVGSLSHS